MENQVIKVLTPEHGEKVIEYWKSKGVDTGNYSGCSCESDGDIRIYYGVINGVFDNYRMEQIFGSDTVEIIELPEEEFDLTYPIYDMTTNEGRLAYIKKHYPNTWAIIIKEEFDMSTNEGRLAYAKKHYPIGTKYKYHGNIYEVNKNTSHIKGESYIHWQVYNHYSNEWAKIIKEDKVMETQKLSRQGLKEIHGVACSYWKGKLQGMGIRNPLEDYIELTQEEVDAMFKACTKEQLPIVSKYLKQDDGSVDLSNGYNGLIAVRLEYEYANKSFWLSPMFNWEIKKDDTGNLCLIPTKKK
jgi:hypothetical protein